MKQTRRMNPSQLLALLLRPKRRAVFLGLLLDDSVPVLAQLYVGRLHLAAQPHRRVHHRLRAAPEWGLYEENVDI